MTLDEVMSRLQALADPRHAAVSQRFFKAGPGEYGEGDRFLGIRVPQVRQLARQCRALTLTQLDSLLQNDIHEARLLALVIMVERFRRGDSQQREALYKLYMKRRAWVNNWDLVDVSAPSIVGGYLVNKRKQPLYGLADSATVWDRRIAVMATLADIREHKFTHTLRLARRLLADEHDLIHKAVGWMLREVGKRDRECLTTFLDRNAATMPRTMLRYAIEKLLPTERAKYLGAGGK